MDFHELVNVILILFPLMGYIIYLGQYNEKSSKNKNTYLDLALFTSIYFYTKHEMIFQRYNLFILVNIPLIIAIIKNRKLVSLLLALTITYLYNNVFDYNIYIILLEYILYFCLSLINVKKKNIIIYILIFTIIKLIFSGFYIDELIFEECIIFIIISFIILYMLDIGEAMMGMNLNSKKIQKEKLVNDSIFKITHEIKNPIAVCKGYLDMFDTSNQEKSEKYVSVLKSEIDRTLNLLQDFLNYSKISIEKEELDIVMLIDEIYENYKVYVEAYKIKLILNNIDDEIYIDGDYKRLKQVFINLIKNSIEAIKEKHIKNGIIKISTSKVDNYFIIIIEDNGMGIDNETMKEIYEPFHTTKINGTGLGVCFSKEIIDKHDGIIKYTSEEGIYTKVEIKLKIKNID